MLYIYRYGYDYNLANNFLHNIHNSIFNIRELDFLSIYNDKKVCFFRLYKNKNNYNNYFYSLSYYHNNKLVNTDIDITLYNIYDIIYKIVSECYGEIIENKVNDVLGTLFVNKNINNLNDTLNDNKN